MFSLGFNFLHYIFSFYQFHDTLPPKLFYLTRHDNYLLQTWKRFFFRYQWDNNCLLI